jgi:CelD/BcsL family acetyltransferase involved in cellulose biosynthesis
MKQADLDCEVVTNHSDMTTNDQLCYSMFVSFEALESFRKEWDGFVESVNGDIYLTFDWCRVWWKYYGAGRDLRIYLFRVGSELVGIIPLFIESMGFSPFRLRLAKIVGSDFTLMVTNLPVHPNWAGGVCSMITDSVLDKGQADAIYWGPQSTNSVFAHAVKEFTSRNPSRYSTFQTKLGCNTNYPLPESHESYLLSLSKSTRKHFRHSYNTIAKKYATYFELTQDRNDFDSFMRMHREQWEKVNKLGHFGDWPYAGEFHRELAEAQSRMGRLRLYSLTADGQPVAYRYAYRFGVKYHSILPARLRGPEWDGYGLGQLTHILTVEQAFKEGICSIDAGRGDYEHKLKLGGIQEEIAGCIMVPNRGYNRFRAKLLYLFSRTLNLLYYRIWLNRLRNWLGCMKPPLWKVWIRYKV